MLVGCHFTRVANLTRLIFDLGHFNGRPNAIEYATSLGYLVNNYRIRN